MELNGLHYDSFKTILQHFDPNLRFQLSLRIPSIRNAERNTPLEIRKLKFEPNKFTMNDVSYSFGTYRNYPNGNALAYHAIDNNGGGVLSDLDQYGFKDHSSDDIMTSGDVNFKLRPNEPINVEDRPEFGMLEELETRLADLETEMNGLLNKAFHNLSIPRENRLNLPAPLRRINAIIAELDFIRPQLQPMLSFRDNIPLGFTPMVQFTVKYPDGRKHVERKQTDLKLYQVQKLVTDFIFGNRRHAVKVKQLEISRKTKNLRLPSDLRFKVRELICEKNSFVICDKLYKSVVHRSSFPLNLVHVRRHKTKGLDHFVFKNSEKLIVEKSDFEENGSWFPEFLTLPNKKIHLRFILFTMEEFDHLIRKWIHNPPEIGTCYTFEMMEEDFIVELYDYARVKFKVPTLGYQSLNIPMTNDCHIKISFISENRARNHEWILKLEIIKL